MDHKQRRLSGSYCPGCGERDLFVTENNGELWAYCAKLGETVENSHTAYRIGKASKKSAAKAPPKPEPEEQQSELEKEKESDSR